MLYVYLLCSRTAGTALLDGLGSNIRNHCAYDNDIGKEIVGSGSRSSFSELFGSGLKLEFQDSQFSLPDSLVDRPFHTHTHTHHPHRVHRLLVG